MTYADLTARKSNNSVEEWRQTRDARRKIVKIFYSDKDLGGMAAILMILQCLGGGHAITTHDLCRFDVNFLYNPFTYLDLRRPFTDVININGEATANRMDYEKD